MENRGYSILKRVIFLFAVVQLSIVHCPLSIVRAQVAAHMKVWDRKYRYPRVNAVEFQGDVPSLAMYDAIYGHGAMWENEWIGFRVYMDHRQSIDLYGKKQARLELDQTNFYTTDEQWQAGYGEDILFVGGSIGAGSFRGYVLKGEENGEKTGELVFVNPVKARGQRVLREGPDTAVVEVYATDWHYEGQLLQFRQRFTAIRGHREVQVDVWISGGEKISGGEWRVESGERNVLDSLNSTQEEKVSSLHSPLSTLHKNLLFATGVQKFEFNSSGTVRSDGLVASWGSNVPDKEGHPDRVHTLGMAVRVAEENLVEVREDSLNYLCIVRPVDGHIRYWLSVASDLEEGGGSHSAKEWFEEVKR